MKEITQEQQELAEHLKVLRTELEGFFEKDHKELKEIKDRAEKIAELQKRLDVITAKIQKVEKQIGVVNAQINANNQQIAALGPQISGATVKSATTQAVITIKQSAQEFGFSFEEQDIRQVFDNRLNDKDLPRKNINEFFSDVRDDLVMSLKEEIAEKENIKFARGEQIYKLLLASKFANGAFYLKQNELLSQLSLQLSNTVDGMKQEQAGIQEQLLDVRDMNEQRNILKF
jgi:hypothetical protein